MHGDMSLTCRFNSMKSRRRCSRSPNSPPRLAAGGKSRALVEECLARIDDPAGEGRRVFLKVHAEDALAAADFHDRLRARGAAPSPFAGIPVSIKDLFDIAGDVTTAGSIVLRDAAPARARCAERRAAARRRLHPDRAHQHDRVRLLRARHQSALRHAGQSLRPQGRPHPRRLVVRRRRLGDRRHGVRRRSAPTPAARAASRRRSAASSASSRPRTAFRPQGAFPLSTSLDSIGPLAATVDCCAVLDAVLAGEPSCALPAFPLDGLRLAVPQTLVLDGVEPAVARAFEAALAALAQGRRAHRRPCAARACRAARRSTPRAASSAAESYAIHRAADRQRPKQHVRPARAGAHPARRASRTPPTTSTSSMRAPISSAGSPPSPRPTTPW